MLALSAVVFLNVTNYFSFRTDIWAKLGFIILALLWFVTTYLAIKTAMQKDFVAHRKWMVRSYALVFSAVTLRVYMPLLTYFIGELGLPTMDPELAVIVTSWINWVPNLIVGELLLKFTPKSL